MLLMLTTPMLENYTVLDIPTIQTPTRAAIGHAVVCIYEIGPI